MPLPILWKTDDKYDCMPATGGNVVPNTVDDVVKSYINRMDEQMEKLYKAGKSQEYIIADYMKSIEQIRESEKKSHIEMYSNEELYKAGSWLKKPIKTIQELIPIFKAYKELRVLDLGCGVGRNSIFIAQEYQNIDCTIECVDILELAIEKLHFNAKEYGVLSKILR